MKAKIGKDTSRTELIKNKDKIEELIKMGKSITSCYYYLKAEKKLSVTYDAFRKALKRHRPDLYELVRYGKKQVMTPQKTRIAPPTSTTVSGKKFAHQKTPRSNLFELADEYKEDGDK